ncbi:translation initiation factor IF-2-like [Peromyscus californicus insignis]|uniref:translation initiation factor IF-2-like n=1 Tax=Peromyscus californicus insignis TaxID=564181 RepID=UPI0022A7F2F4|nr:translation initiation factor IF-2-like [Peromyscus californicus insignis]
MPSAPSFLAVHLSPRPPPSFPSAFRCTPTRHAWMPRAGSSLCGAPTTAIRSRAGAAPAPGAPTWKPPATPGSRAQLRAEFPRNPKVVRRSMSICLRPTTPSQDVNGRFGSSSVPSYPWTKPPAFRLPTPEIQGGPDRGKGTRVESALKRLARMRVPVVSQPCLARLLPRLHPRRGAAERRPGGAGGCTPTCRGERALSQPLLLGWRRLDLRNAPPHPPSALSLLGVSATASETQCRL